MAVQDSNTKAIIDAITHLVKEMQHSNQTVEKEIKNLSVNTKSFIEKAQSSANFAKAFEAFSKEFSTNISESIKDSVKEVNEKTFKQLKEGIESKKKEIEKSKSSKSEDPEVQKELDKKIKQSQKELKELIENYDKTVKANNQKLIQQIRETQANLTEELVGGLQEVGKNTFKNYVKETKNVDEALIKYKNALKEQYTSLEKNADTRKNLGITDKKMEEIKEDLYDSYFKELETQSNRADIDEKTRKVLTDKLKREQILAGRSSYEQTYGKTSSIGQLAGRLADFTTSRYKKQDQNTSALGKSFNAGLGALFKGKGAKEPFLEADKNDLSTKPSITQADIEGGEGRTYIERYSEPGKEVVTPDNKKETVQMPEADKASADVANTSVNPSAQVEALEAIQQSFEEAKENVPFKVIISDLDDKAQKGITAAFNEAFKETLGPVIKEALSASLQGDRKGMVKALGKPGKDKDDGSIIDVDDITDLIPKGKKGFFKKAAQKGLKYAGKGLKYAGKGLKVAGKIAGKAALPLAVAMSAYEGYQGFTNAKENLGIKDREADYDEKLASGGASIASGLTFGLVKEESFISDKRKKEIENENLLTENNKKLQDVSKIKDPNERKIAYFEAQLDTLEKQKTVQSGDEKAQTEHMITKVKQKLEKLKNSPEVTPASDVKSATPSEVTPASDVKSAITPGISAAGASPAASSGVTAALVGGSTLPTITANIPQSKDNTPELALSNKLTEQNNQILTNGFGEMIKVLTGKDFSPAPITPIMVAQASPNNSTGQSQSPASQFRSEHRV